MGHPLVGSAVAVAGDEVGAAGGLDANVGKDHAAYVLMDMCTEATLEMAMLSSCPVRSGCRTSATSRG